DVFGTALSRRSHAKPSRAMKVNPPAKSPGELHSSSNTGVVRLTPALSPLKFPAPVTPSRQPERTLVSSLTRNWKRFRVWRAGWQGVWRENQAAAGDRSGVVGE